jgi:hypothetical protein
MNHIRFIRLATSLMVAAASSLLGLMLFTPSAFALVMRPVGDGSSTAAAPQTAPATAHYVVSTGMAGWQIALIAVAAAVFTAALAVFTDRARGSHRKVSASAA